MKRLACLSVVLAAWCGTAAGDVKEPPAKLAKLYGDKAIAILKGATRVEVFRLGDAVDPEKTKEGKDKVFHGYLITAKGDDQGEKFAQKAVALLFDRRNFYLAEAAKDCDPQPGVGLRFWKGKESVDLVLCYECADLWVVAPDAKGRVVEGRALDFGPGRAPFVKLAKEMFPKDKQIQGLKDRE